MMDQTEGPNGVRAIEEAADLSRYFRLRGGSPPLKVEQIQGQMRLAVDRVMSEGALYSTRHAALAIKQSEGDIAEAALLLRAFRSTRERTDDSAILDTSEMTVVRRVSAAFKNVPGGQVLGPTPDYSQRLLAFELCHEDAQNVSDFLARYLPAEVPPAGDPPPTFPRVVDMLKQRGLVHDTDGLPLSAPTEDITRTGLSFPASRSARLQALARGDTGAMLTLAYTAVRAYGHVHPTIADLRVGEVPVRVEHPVTRQAVVIGRVVVTEVEVIGQFTAAADGTPRFILGYGLCFGQSELKALSMAILDLAMGDRSGGGSGPAADEEFVLSHIDGVEFTGFGAHYKLPHYVTFQAAMDRLRVAQQEARQGRDARARR